MRGASLAGWIPFALAFGVVTGTRAETNQPEYRLTPKQAVRRALRQNLSLQADRLDPALSTASERAAAAAFHPSLFGESTVSGSPGNVSPQRAGLEPTSTTQLSGEVGARKLFSVGTTIEARLSSSALFGGGGLDPAYQSGLNLSARQALLQGISRRANEAPITTARLNRESATARLARRAELLAAETLRAYWDLRATIAQVKIEELALQMTEQTLQETEALIAAGKLPASERASAAYTVQLARRAKVQTEQELSNVRDRLARLIGLVGPDSLATPQIVPISSPRRTPPKISLGELQQKALRGRGDYQALQLAAKLEATQELVAVHRLLPRLDLLASLGLSGLSGTAADPEPGSPQYSRSYWASFGMDRVGWTAGLVLELPLGNAEARADRELAELRTKRASASVRLAQQELSLELNLGWRAVQAARQQLRLTEEAARVAEEKLANETARYKAGKITAHILSTVQAEAITERLGREQALATLVKAVVDLQASAGILLARLKLRPDGTVLP